MRSLKKSGLQRDSNPWPPRYRCDALPTELWSHTLWARSIYWVHIFPCSKVMWSIYEIIHICTAVVYEVKSDPRSKFSNLSNWKWEAWKKSGLQRDSNPWPPRYRCDALPTELDNEQTRCRHCNQGFAVKELTYDANNSIELLRMLKLINYISCCVLCFSFVSNLAPLMLSTCTIFGICKEKQNKKCC